MELPTQTFKDQWLRGTQAFTVFGLPSSSNVGKSTHLPFGVGVVSDDTAVLSPADDSPLLVGDLGHQTCSGFFGLGFFFAFGLEGPALDSFGGTDFRSTSNLTVRGTALGLPCGLAADFAGGLGAASTFVGTVLPLSCGPLPSTGFRFIAILLRLS